MSGQKTYFNWSSGKDSALALHYLLEDKRYHVDYLLTTVNQHYKRVSMHGLRVALLQRQLDAIGIESSWVELPENPSHATYEQLMAKKASQLKAEGFEYAAFGDIFLEDLREYREKQLESVKLKALFPLWKKDTRELIH
ncbi:MAG: ATP-binding protein, partial [Bacteroidota bacterium]